MDTLMGTLAIFAPLAIIVLLAGYASVLLWQRALGEVHPLLLGRMLARQGGPQLARSAMLGDGAAFATAVRRCVSCPSTKTCGQWLDAGGRAGHAEFCPNAGFIERLKA
jgi:hypothetical protein